MGTHSRAAMKNTNHGNEVLPQDTTHFMQRPRYQRGSPCQNPSGNRSTRRPSHYGKETQSEVVWPCLPFIRSGQNHLARHGERGKKTRQTGKEVGGQHEFAKSRRAVENREKWRKLVVRSSVALQRPLRLRDR